MDFSPAPRPRAAAENIVPMINVVFLLLIFFLMSARITTPPPVEITPPVSDAQAAPDAQDTLFVSRDGALYFRGMTGPQARAALRASGLTRVTVEADRGAELARFAGLLADLRAAGVETVDLVTGGRR